MARLEGPNVVFGITEAYYRNFFLPSSMPPQKFMENIDFKISLLGVGETWFRYDLVNGS